MEFQAHLPKYMTETFHAQEMPRQAQASRIKKNPSKKSRKIPNATNPKAISKLLWKAKMSAMQPQNKLSKVIKLGMCFLRGIVEIFEKQI